MFEEKVGGDVLDFSEKKTHFKVDMQSSSTSYNHYRMSFKGSGDVSVCRNAVDKLKHSYAEIHFTRGECPSSSDVWLQYSIRHYISFLVLYLISQRL